MTDDEISEFAEFLWTMCAQSPKPIRPIDGTNFGCECPLWAAGISSGGLARHGDVPSRGQRLLHDEDAARFIDGFDGPGEWPEGFHGTGRDESHPLTKLGLLFREHALSGEAW